jgi:hypothetical protein
VLTIIKSERNQPHANGIFETQGWNVWNSSSIHYNPENIFLLYPGYLSLLTARQNIKSVIMIIAWLWYSRATCMIMITQLNRLMFVYFNHTQGIFVGKDWEGMPSSVWSLPLMSILPWRILVSSYVHVTPGWRQLISRTVSREHHWCYSSEESVFLYQKGFRA